MTDLRAFSKRGFDGVALKPTEIDLDRVCAADVERAIVDYEGGEHVPSTSLLEEFARETTVRLTTPVRADGFDPLGDAPLSKRLPAGVGRVLVAGNPAYLTDDERRRAIAPRLGAARTDDPEAWIGTEGVERLALAAGGTQFELLSPSATAEVRALRAAGFDDEIAVYAPVVLSDDEATLLDTLGAYVARRGSVAAALENARTEETNRAAVADGAPTDATATGRSRAILLEAIDEFALVGRPARVGERIEELRSAGVDTVIGYPARGPDALGR
ncbi:DUF7388 family protein [Halococcus agarilyticus]|uniref:DUF7388 family protein n=1 Tax=Halococcus agarilyticus TaxID=1232219 RepID=UPI00067803C6|nr:LLM class flavin-dependent oxidoreductase [Halococcus agarilyticus]